MKIVQHYCFSFIIIWLSLICTSCRDESITTQPPGPSPEPFVWEQQTALQQTHIYSFAFTSAGLNFAASDSGNIYRSSSTDSSWTKLNVVSDTGKIRSVTVNSLQQVFAVHERLGIFKSTNDGVSWGRAITGLVDSSINAVSMTAQFYVSGSEQGYISISSNAGDSWLPLFNLMHSITTIGINSSNIVFAGTWSDGFYRFDQFGNNLAQINTGLLNLYPQCLAIDFEDRLFSGCYNGGVFRSTNSGDLWQQFPSVLDTIDIRSVAVNNDNDIFAAAQSRIYRSVDHGVHWASLDSGFTATVIYTLAINSSGFVYASTDNGIFRSKSTTIRATANRR